MIDRYMTTPQAADYVGLSAQGLRMARTRDRLSLIHI